MIARFAATALASAFILSACTSMPTDQAPTPTAQANLEASETLKQEVSGLNNLIAIMSDASTLYAEAKDMSGDVTLSSQLGEIITKREDFGAALQVRVADLGGSPATRGEALGTAHRAFTQGRAMIQNDAEVAVEEVLRGENYLIDEISKLLSENFTRETDQMLQNELQKVRADRDTLNKTRERIMTEDKS